MEIYIELTRKQLKSMEEGTWKISLPLDVEMTRRKGSRACYLTTEDENSFQTISSILDNLGLSWQRND